MFIPFKDQWRLTSLGHRHGDDFIPKGAVLGGAFGFVIASQGDFIHFFAADLEVLSHKFRGMPHDIGFSTKAAQR